MKRFTIFAGAMLLGLALASCDKDGTHVEIEDEDVPKPLNPDLKSQGLKSGELFGNGVMAIKDTVATAYESARKGFPYDTLAFIKMITPALADCQWPFEQYKKAASTDSTFQEWEAGFMEKSTEQTRVDRLTISAMLNKYKMINMSDLTDRENIQKAFDIAKLLGGKQAELVNKRVN